MKAAYVSDLTPDTTITSFFLVAEKELRSTREGKSFLRIELSDRSGSIEARVWDNVEGVAATFDRDDIVKVQARVESYKTRMQLSRGKTAPGGARRSGPGGLFSAHGRGRREALQPASRIRGGNQESLAQPPGVRRDRGPGDCAAPEARSGGQGHAPCFLGGLLEQSSACAICAAWPLNTTSNSTRTF